MNEADEKRIRSQLVDVLRENRVQPFDATTIPLVTCAVCRASEDEWRGD